MHVTSTLACDVHAICRLLISCRLDTHLVKGVTRSDGMMQKSETCGNLALQTCPSAQIHKHYCPMHEGFCMSEAFCSGAVMAEVTAKLALSIVASQQ